MTDSFSIHSDCPKATCMVAHLSGEADASNLNQLEALGQTFQKKSGAKLLVFDCHSLRFIDSKTVGFFAYLHSTLKRSGRTFALAGLDETVQDILNLVGLLAILPHFSTSEEALHSLS